MLCVWVWFYLDLLGNNILYGHPYILYAQQLQILIAMEFVGKLLFLIATNHCICEHANKHIHLENSILLPCGSEFHFAAMWFPSLRHKKPTCTLQQNQHNLMCVSEQNGFLICHHYVRLTNGLSPPQHQSKCQVVVEFLFQLHLLRHNTNITIQKQIQFAQKHVKES